MQHKFFGRFITLFNVSTEQIMTHAMFVNSEQNHTEKKIIRAFYALIQFNLFPHANTHSTPWNNPLEVSFGWHSSERNPHDKRKQTTDLLIR